MAKSKTKKKADVATDKPVRVDIDAGLVKPKIEYTPGKVKSPIIEKTDKVEETRPRAVPSKMSTGKKKASAKKVDNTEYVLKSVKKSKKAKKVKF